VQARAEAEGVGWRTVAKAKADMGILSRKIGHVWYWQYPIGPDLTDDPEAPPWD